MCGIFGVVNKAGISKIQLESLARWSERRGKDSSGLFLFREERYELVRSSEVLTRLLDKVCLSSADFIMGHSRLVTNGLNDNQPIYRDSVCVIHNGIIVNDSELWRKTEMTRRQEIDTEIIAAMVGKSLSTGLSLTDAVSEVLSKCKGIVACAVAIPEKGKLCLFSNNGSLFIGKYKQAEAFASERHTLEEAGFTSIRQIKNDPVILDIPISKNTPVISDGNIRKVNLVPSLGSLSSEEKILEHRPHNLRRCVRCILPETMPFIRFDSSGVCNYCLKYKYRNRPKPIQELVELVQPYRRNQGNDCIVPFSGGRDSCYGLHVVTKHLRMKPITYTYDWGMVTDLGRRNISRMCAQLGIENIIVADDISKKRRNIAKNLDAWLKSPNLGMISILTAGDKHFFRYVEHIKRETGISLNLWGVNPLEVTHFKSGFLGIVPDFEEERVYSSGLAKQARYQWLRFSAMVKSPSYFNSSLWDTISGEYYRSITRKDDYYHIYDYYKWEENEIDKTLIEEYNWELAPDTKTTWRIGDGTAAFYNYIYYKVAGFTEHDTFRSNQIREGDISRERALELVEDENRPRYPNIKWYLAAIEFDFKKTIERINQIPSLY